MSVFYHKLSKTVLDLLIELLCKFTRTSLDPYHSHFFKKSRELFNPREVKIISILAVRLQSTAQKQLNSQTRGCRARVARYR